MYCDGFIDHRLRKCIKKIDIDGGENKNYLLMGHRPSFWKEGISDWHYRQQYYRRVKWQDLVFTHGWFGWPKRMYADQQH